MKSYVKEFDGQEVPSGAKYYSKADVNQKSYFYDEKGRSIGDKSAFVIYFSDLVELPEQPMPSKAEWMPKVGEEFEFNYGPNHERNHWQKSKIVAITSRFFVYTQDDLDGEEVDMIDSVIFRPLKTVEEKKREAFIEGLVKVLNSVPNGASLSDLHAMAEKAYDSGYIAPDGEL